MIRASWLFTVLLVAGCGPGTPRASATLRTRLASSEATPARDRAPDLIARVEHALDDADRAERAGDDLAAADHATAGRLLLEAALAEAARVEDETERTHIEQEIATVLARARRDEQAREGISQVLSRGAAIAAARAEAQRALTQAEEDEARPRRRTRVSLAEAADLRRAAAALRARARLSMAAARALGAETEALAAAATALSESEASHDPRASLRAADTAHHESMRALGQIRASADGPGPDASAELAEAARGEGFEVLALAEGTAVEADGVFNGASSSVARSAGHRIERLASLIAAHPHGPVQVQAQVAQQGRAGDQIAQRRAQALQRALVAAGASDERLSAQPLPVALRGDTPLARVRLVFVAYAR